MQFRITILLLVGLYFTPAHTQTVEYIGHIERYDGHKACRLYLSDENPTFRIYGFIATNWSITNYTEEAGVVKWTASYGAQIIKFSGNLTTDNKTLSGTAVHQGVTYPFELQRRVNLNETEMTPYTGYYRTSNKDVFQVIKNRQTLHLHSPISGEYLVLKGVGGDHFLSQTLEEFQFTDPGPNGYEQLTWTDHHGNQVIAKKYSPFDTEDVQIVTSLDTLYGTLYLPKLKQKAPCIMLCLGAGRYDRWNYALEAKIFASYGYAALIVDFPGTGESSGQVEANTFDDKKQMTIEIFRRLQQHDRIQPEQIVLRGGSQSGRIAIMAAAELPKAAGVLTVNAPVTTFLETQLFAIEQYLRNQSIDEITIAKSTEYWSAYYQQIHEGQLDQQLMTSISSLSSDHPNLYLPPSHTTRLPLSPHKEDIYSSAMPALKKVSCPVLFQLGTEDERVPYQTVLHQVGEVQKLKSNHNIKIISYTMADHSMMLPGYQIAQNLFLDKINWLKSILED